MLPHISKGDFVWLDSSLAAQNNRQFGGTHQPDYPAIAARVLAIWADQQGGEHILLLDERQNKLELGSVELQRWAIRPMHPTSIQGVPNLAEMSEVHEAALLRNLQIRFKHGIFHTSIGPNILLSIFPQENSASNQRQKEYKERPIRELSPHLFSIGAQILNGFKNIDEFCGPNSQNCCVVFSGECGSGKTESVKELLNFLIPNNSTELKAKINAANLLIEAFGNAKSAQNLNASRHGKQIECDFAKNSDGELIISGIHFELYLLEKSRIIEASTNSSNDGNFHIFYSLLNGINSQQKLQMDLAMDRPNNYRLLNSIRQNSYNSSDDENFWQNKIKLAEIVAAMRILQFREAEIDGILRILAAILHLGNLTYSGNMDGKVELIDRQNIQRICRLLKFDETFFHSILTIKNEFVNGEKIQKLMEIEEAINLRDKLIIELYARIVEYILAKINEALSPTKTLRKEQKIGTIHLLDFQGIENNLKCGNNFEQLALNYAAECVQQFFIRRIYKLEEAEYAAQGIPDWEPGCIPFVDNLQILEMLAVQPLSIMSVIDDISIMPKATDDELLAKLHQTQTQNERFYQKPKSDLVKQFAIRHYCDTVQYKVNGMIEKNRDQFPGQLRALVHSSESKFLRRIFEPNLPISIAGKLQNNREDGISSATTISRLKEQSQSTRIRRAMDTLMSRMEKCEQVYFVRCLKANDQQNEKEFDSDVVLRQIRNFDLLSNIEMCKATFPIQIDYAQFVHKFRPLLPGIPPPQFCHCAQAAKFICHQIFGHNFCAEIVQFGKSKIFMKAEQHQTLEIMRERRLKRCAILVGKCLQGWAKRQQFERLRWAAIVLQKNWRTLAERRKFQKFIRGITRLQALVRAHQLVLRYQWLRNTITHFQANCRAALLRHQLGCLATGAERNCAMKERLKWQMISQGEAPALELHRNELDLCQNTNFHSINLAPKIRNIGQGNGQGILQNDGIEKFKWEKFALANFQKSQCPKHCRLQIQRSQLPQPKLFDELLAIAIWRRLLQLMGDLNAINESKNETKGKSTKNGIPPILARMKAIYSKEFTPNELKYLHSELMNFQNFDENTNNLRKSTKMAKNLLIEEKSTALEKIQFIIAIGIFRPNLRDEIFSQICKQINGNPSKQSTERGWNLLMLFSSCFMPSQRLLPYLVNFVKSNKCKEFEEEFEWRMQRTRKNGTRKEPIIRAELASIFASKSMIINVKLADGRLIQLPIDSQSTASEICTNLSAKINLKNSFGFGLFLSAGQIVRTLGSGREKLMDAFAQAEQQGIENWEIYLRKEIFQPFKSAVSDPISIDLAYRQIVRGIHLGEYQCEKEEELALLAAQQYFIAKNGENRMEMDVPDLEETLEEYLPLTIWQNIGQGDEGELRQKWVQLIMNAQRKKIIKNDQLPVPNVAQIKEQFLEFAAIKWPLLFSKFFEVYKYSGPSLPANQLILGVNSEGIVFLDPKDEQQRILLDIEFIQLESIGYGRSKQQGAEAISLQLLNGERYTFQSSMARELSQLLSYMLHGLKNQSRFAIAIKNDANSSKNASNNLAKGDLLILNTPFGEQMASLTLNCGQICLENTRTGMRQNVPLEAIHILACTQKPGLDQIELLLSKKLEENVNNLDQEKAYNSSNALYEYTAFIPAGPFGMPMPFFGHLTPQPHTLEKFAANNFRQPQIVGIYGGQEELWRHSRNPLNGPLLKRIESSGKEEVIQECLISYSYILKYMGDQPSHPQQYFLEHSDLIFAAPLKYEILRDETYCQLMKQLTENGNPISEERGWELMWLCLGLFPPSKGLRRELIQFLRSRFLPMAADCAIRLERALSQWPDQSCTRNFAPHQVELEAIQHRQTQIYHKFYLPDGSLDTIEVESWTRGKDFGQRIAAKIKLSSAHGFALFVKLGEKVVCIPEHEFFFDFIHQLQDWARKNARRKNGGIGINSWNFNYQVHFMRKLWLDVEPGMDNREDLIFNYHQELPKYLRGYHRIDKKEAIHFGALILRAQTRDEKKIPLQHIQHILHELVPKDLLKSYSPNEWKKLISAEIEQPEFPKKSADAKIEFLKRIGREPTFGSAFFEVKQSADPTLCSKLLVAINREGMSLYEQESKRHIQTFAFEQISHWQPANTYFHITLDKGNRLLFETTLGHKLDGNAYRVFYGDMLFLYSICEIGEGEEITTHYCNPSLTKFNERKKKLKKWGFECKCEMCLLDGNDHRMEQKRENLLKMYKDIRGKALTESATKWFKPILNLVEVEKMRETYKNRAKFRIHLILPLMTLRHLYLSVGEPTKAIEVCKEANEALGEPLVYFHQPQLNLVMAEIYAFGLNPPNFRMAKKIAREAYEMTKIRTGIKNEELFHQIYKNYPRIL